MKTEEKVNTEALETKAINPFAVVSHFVSGENEDDRIIHSDLGISEERNHELCQRMQDFVDRRKVGDEININWPEAFQELTYDVTNTNEAVYIAFSLTYSILDVQIDTLKRILHKQQIIMTMQNIFEK
jgi:hypothetical protein